MAEYEIPASFDWDSLFRRLTHELRLNKARYGGLTGLDVARYVSAEMSEAETARVEELATTHQMLRELIESVRESERMSEDFKRGPLPEGLRKTPEWALDRASRHAEMLQRAMQSATEERPVEETDLSGTETPASVSSAAPRPRATDPLVLQAWVDGTSTLRHGGRDPYRWDPSVVHLSMSTTPELGRAFDSEETDEEELPWLIPLANLALGCEGKEHLLLRLSAAPDDPSTWKLVGKAICGDCATSAIGALAPPSVWGEEGCQACASFAKSLDVEFQREGDEFPEVSNTLSLVFSAPCHLDAGVWLLVLRSGAKSASIRLELGVAPDEDA